VQQLDTHADSGRHAEVSARYSRQVRVALCFFLSLSLLDLSTIICSGRASNLTPPPLIDGIWRHVSELAI
jgi:hypothetical protein